MHGLPFLDFGIFHHWISFSRIHIWWHSEIIPVTSPHYHNFYICFDHNCLPWMCMFNFARTRHSYADMTVAIYGPDLDNSRSTCGADTVDGSLDSIFISEGWYNTIFIVGCGMEKFLGVNYLPLCFMEADILTRWLILYEFDGKFVQHINIFQDYILA